MTGAPVTQTPGTGQGSPLARTGFGLVVLLSLVVLFVPGDGVPTGLEINDKVVHGTLFAVLALTGRWAGLPLAPLAGALGAYAAVSEVLQALLPISRDGTVGDALADVVGVAAGLVLALVLRRSAPLE